jgi:periplasmic nitrate reductase NapE
MASEQRRELMVFVFLALVLAPVLAVLIVAGFGFCVWMYQLLAGPPGVCSGAAASSLTHPISLACARRATRIPARTRLRA